MPGIGDRIEGWVDKVSEKWKGRLQGWMAGWVEKGLNTYLTAREPEIIKATQETLRKMRQQPGISPELKNLIDKSLQTGDIATIVIGWVLTLIGAIPQILSLGAPLGRLAEYAQDITLRTARLDPAAVIAAWRRDPATYDKFFDDLRSLGWSDERIEAWKFITEIIPGVQDLVRMAVREAFTPEIAAKFGQYEDFPGAVVPWGQKQGLSKEWLERYWAAHWDLPSPMQGF